MEFKGYDFSELGAALGVELPEWYAVLRESGLHPSDGSAEDPLMSKDDWLRIQMIRAVLLKCIDSAETSAMVRGFIAALIIRSEGYDYQTPVWRGLLAVQDNKTLIQLTVLLLPAMWA